MPRVFWSAQYDEAHVVQALLRSRQIEAWVFDADMARQDWFRVLAIGGYRVMIADADAARATELVGEYREGTLAVVDDAVERPTCPRCATPGSDDPVPHRLVFSLLIAIDVVIGLGLLLAAGGSNKILAVLFGSSVIVAPTIAVLFTRHLKGRYVCPKCTTRWRTPPVAFAKMAQDVDAAVDAEGAAKGAGAR